MVNRFCRGWVWRSTPTAPYGIWHIPAFPKSSHALTRILLEIFLVGIGKAADWINEGLLRYCR